MPGKPGKAFPTMSDLVRREDEIRKATNRAEARLANDLSQAGGLESAKKHSMAIRKWEQEQVKQELNNIKTAYKRSNILRMQDPEFLEHVDPQLAEDMEEQEFLASQHNDGDENGIESSKDYGRNFFGYTSQPGSNKPHFQQIRALKDKYSHVKNYYEYSGPKIMDKNTREKLRKQKMMNEDVQEKVKSFTAPEKRQVAGYQALSETAKDVVQEDMKDGASDDSLSQKTSQKAKKPIPITAANTPVPVAPCPSPTEQLKQEVTSNMEMLAKSDAIDSRVSSSEAEYASPMKEATSRRSSRIQISSPNSSSRNWENSSTVGSTMGLSPYRTTKPKTALDLVFDADTYAPDGRLRTVHTLPDFDKSLKEARQARYIRTKHKREVDRELSVNEMFGR